jgi:TPR repeat protein
MPLFPTVDLRDLNIKSAKSLVIKSIQENRSNGISRVQFMTGDENSDQENVHNNFPRWMSDTTIKHLIKSCVRNDGSYVVFLKLSNDEETFYNVNVLQQKAINNDVDAQLILGLMYLDNDKDSDQDAKVALKWLTKSAEQGDVNAQLMIANLLHEGKGVTKNETEAFKWFTQAAEGENPDAQYNLGLMYLEGDGVTRDVEEAYKWLKKSARQGHSDAQLTIGNLLYEGKIFDKDIKTATKLFRLAAKQNNIHAQMIMGEMYIREQNDKKALKWIKMAAEHENSDAQFMLGQMYAKGKGVKLDYVEAIKWFKKAADQGHHEAGIVSSALT